MIKTFPNQKWIEINRENVKGAKTNNRPYLVAYHDNLITAMKVLTPAAFKIYVYLLFNTDGFNLVFSPEHIHQITGLCKDTIRKSLNLLEQRGYIECEDFHKYHFYESYSVPRKQIKIN